MTFQQQKTHNKFITNNLYISQKKYSMKVHQKLKRMKNKEMCQTKKTPTQVNV
jgi:hypothetical protein